MSRIGAKPIALPDGVKIKIDSEKVAVEGPKGKLSAALMKPITVKVADKKVILERPDDSIPSKVKHGSMRSLIEGMVRGVSEGFTKRLSIEGVGFKSAVQGKKINLALGFSHPVVLDIPQGIEVKCAKPTEIEISGICKQTVGFFASKIRSCYEPEPYKGKGVRYAGEVVRRKAGKSVAK